MRFQGVERLARPISTGPDQGDGVLVVSEDVVNLNIEVQPPRPAGLSD